jgi:hypothetical protein
MVNAEAMTPVNVKEVMACREKLGITQLCDLSGASESISRVRVRPREEGIGTPPPRTVMIFPPTSADGRISAADIKRLPPLYRRNLCCAAFSESNELPDDLRRFSEAEGIPVFSSCYDASLLKSRLIGLLREKGGRRIMCHGVLIQLSGQGILITGDSGIGKTACSLELASRGGYWIADDAVILEGRGDHLYGRGHRRTKKWIAVRGRGILDARDLLGAQTIRKETRVDVMIRFVGGSSKEGTVRGEGDGSMLDIVGVPLLCRRLEAGDGPRRMSDQVMNAIDGLLPSIAHRRAAHDCKKGLTDPAGGDRR